HVTTPFKANWSDWLPPQDLPTRIRLEFARLAYPAILSAEEVLARIDGWMGERGPDADRLASLRLRLLLAQALPATERLWQTMGLGAEAAMRFLAEPQAFYSLVAEPAPASCNAH